MIDALLSVTTDAVGNTLLHGTQDFFGSCLGTNEKEEAIYCWFMSNFKLYYIDILLYYILCNEIYILVNT